MAVENPTKGTSEGEKDQERVSVAPEAQPQSSEDAAQKAVDEADVFVEHFKDLVARYDDQITHLESTDVDMAEKEKLKELREQALQDLAAAQRDLTGKLKDIFPLSKEELLQDLGGQPTIAEAMPTIEALVAETEPIQEIKPSTATSVEHQTTADEQAERRKVLNRKVAEYRKTPGRKKSVATFTHQLTDRELQQFIPKDTRTLLQKAQGWGRERWSKLWNKYEKEEKAIDTLIEEIRVQQELYQAARFETEELARAVQGLNGEITTQQKRLDVVEEALAAHHPDITTEDRLLEQRLLQSLKENYQQTVESLQERDFQCTHYETAMKHLTYKAEASIKAVLELYNERLGPLYERSSELDEAIRAAEAEHKVMTVELNALQRDLRKYYTTQGLSKASLDRAISNGSEDAHNSLKKIEINIKNLIGVRARIEDMLAVIDKTGRGRSKLTEWRKRLAILESGKLLNEEKLSESVNVEKIIPTLNAYVSNIYPDATSERFETFIKEKNKEKKIIPRGTLGELLKDFLVDLIKGGEAERTKAGHLLTPLLRYFE